MRDFTHVVQKIIEILEEFNTSIFRRESSASNHSICCLHGFPSTMKDAVDFSETTGTTRLHSGTSQKTALSSSVSRIRVVALIPIRMNSDTMDTSGVCFGDRATARPLSARDNTAPRNVG